MRLLALAFSFLAAYSSAAVAETGGKAFGMLPVRADVRPTASLKFEIKSTELFVTAVDIERGYIDLPASFLAVNVGGTLPSVVVEFTPVADLFRSMEIRTTDAVAAAGGSGRGSTTEGQALVTYRLNLDSRARPGLYPLPLTISVVL